MTLLHVRLVTTAHATETQSPDRQQHQSVIVQRSVQVQIRLEKRLPQHYKREQVK